MLPESASSRFSCRRKILIALFAMALSLGAAFPLRANADELKTDVVPADGGSAAQSPQKTTHSEVNLETDSASSVGHHHYKNDAERAQDALVITEVKAALADDGITNGYPVEVDSDHGTVTLTGVVATGDDVSAAAEDAADVEGVKGVRNLLKPH